SNTASATTRDLTAPTPPNNLRATAVNDSQINLLWDASADNVGVAGYRVERCQGVTCTNFVEVAQPTTTNFNDTGRSPATAYQYRVRAVDAAGNLSGYSNIAAATTPNISDTTAPTQPGKLAAAALNQSEIALSWEPSTDNVGVTGYRVERCLVTGLCSEFDAGPTLNVTDKGLAIATAYVYRVRAYDAAGNLSLYSDTARAITGSILFKANFDNDALDKQPDTTLPGDPVGDSLALSGSAGTILVRGAVGELTTRPVELDQTGGTGGLALRGTVAGTPPKSGVYTARWRSLVSSPNAAFAAIVLRDSSGRILASLAYRPNGLLDYNDKNPNGIGVGWKPNLPQAFEIEVNLDKKSTTLRVDGKEFIVSAPFYEDVAADLAQISMELGTTEKQTLAWDDIEITANVP
ncbi:MAG: fibronectin type III domain-containing protein, partial [Candidatus Manganitrophaceae bacterium]